MEKILNKILDRLDSIDKRFDSVDERFDSMENRLINLENGQQSLQLEQNALRKGQQSLLSEQSEMRKEVAFYFGTLMKELDETKSDLLNEMKVSSNLPKQYQDLSETLNENQG